MYSPCLVLRFNFFSFPETPTAVKFQHYCWCRPGQPWSLCVAWVYADCDFVYKMLLLHVRQSYVSHIYICLQAKNWLALLTWTRRQQCAVSSISALSDDFNLIMNKFHIILVLQVCRERVTFNTFNMLNNHGYKKVVLLLRPMVDWKQIYVHRGR